MIEVHGHQIDADISSVLTELRTDLSAIGLPRFNKIIESGNNVQTNCPFHGDGQERKPSFGIMIEDRGNRKAGTCHCFACGWSGSIEEMISACFGYTDFGRYGAKYLLGKYVSVAIEERADIDLGLDDFSTSDVIEYVSEDILDTYRYYHDYMFQRNLTDEVIEVFDVGYDIKTNCITFPIRDETGNTLFVARRSVQVKYFNYPADAQKPVYGLYELNQLEKYPNTVYICESILDALSIWGAGKYAVALNGLGSSYQFNQLRKMPNRHFILALDNDDKGRAAVYKIRKELPNKLLSQVEFPSGRKDVNECTFDEINNFKIITI